MRGFDIRHLTVEQLEKLHEEIEKDLEVVRYELIIKKKFKHEGEWYGKK